MSIEVKKLVLASTSRYRAMLLERLQLPFDTAAPDIDESPLPGEAPAALTERLALGKACEVAGQFSDALVVGSDQVAVLGDDILGKPGTSERAISQLQRLSGNHVDFLTSLCVLDSKTGDHEVTHVSTPVQFRELELAEIEAYVRYEQPLDCAGSFKSEALGITLFRSIGGSDPNALIGLPLIRLCEMLSKFGVNPLLSR